MNIIILGAGGGIGQALVESYLADPGVERIYATHHRSVSSISPQVRWLQLDLADPVSMSELTEYIEEPIDRWICCTGILAGSHGGPEKTLRQLQSEKLLHDYQVNAVGPLTVFSSLASRLRTNGMRAVFLSAQVGSIGDNRLGGWYGYRMSKAALNMGVRCLAIECGRWRSAPAVVAVHPGTTVSGLSQNFIQARKAPVQTAAQCAIQLKGLIESLTAEHNGQFLRLNGESVPW